METYYRKTIEFIREIFATNDMIPLHQPSFIGNEKSYLENCIDTGYVSSVGQYVVDLEKSIAEYCGVQHAVATANGTSALHIALLLSGVKSGEEVISQPLTFIATINAISYCGASPVFLDIDKETLGLSPDRVQEFLASECIQKSDGFYYNRKTDRRIAACLPMHTFGHPVRIDELARVCNIYGIPLIEDAAESMGSLFNGKHTGTFGKIGVLSFNGNKIITSGGGGAIVTNDELIAKKAKHLTTQAKVPHPWEFDHDEIGYNYRMPNINAAICLAQLENLNLFLQQKRKLAFLYECFFKETPFIFIKEPKLAKANYWLNAILLPDKNERDKFLIYSNKAEVTTRPSWKLINQLNMYKEYQVINPVNSVYIAERLVNIPSSFSLTY